MNTSWLNFFTPSSKSRAIALRISLVLGLIGLFLGISIIASLFEMGSFFSVVGSFFVLPYGVLALLIPAYLIYAAFLLAEPGYKPDRIFILAAMILPFITAALGLFAIRDFDSIARNSIFLARAGRFGIGFLTAIITAMEILLIMLLRSIFFYPNETISFFAGKKSGDTSKPKKILGFLPAPKYRKLKDIYAESAANEPGAGEFSVINSVYVKSAADSSSDDSDLPIEKIEEISEIEKIEEVEELETFEDEKAPASELVTDEALAYEASADKVSGANKAAAKDDDVERALAEASANAAVMAAEAAARHSPEKDASQSRSARRRRLPYSVPVEGILNQYPDGEYWIIDDATRNAAVTLKDTLKEFNIQAEVTGIKKGPVITMFEILPAPGVKLSRIVNLQDNIALRLAASSVRIVAPIPGKHAVGIEVPNAKRNIVSFREIVEGELGQDGKRPEIPIVLGKDITGEAQTVDLATMPHLLIAGATGSGKSVCVNSMILSVLYQKSPAECRFILIDPKIVELKLYNDIPHLLTPVITEPKRAFQALQYCICEMERRYACLDSMGVRDIRSYNKRIKERSMAAEFMPYIIVVIDEFADLMATTGKELESTVARLAAMSRAIGIHLVLATQRPSIDVITGLIKANIPSRIAFMVASKMDSRIIIDMVGAEKLLGRGDMLYAGAVDPFPVRMQGAFISEEEVERVVDYVKSLGEPDYIDDEIFFDDDEDDSSSLFTDGDDPLYDKALEIVFQQGKASASFIQRRLKIGYNRAARLVEEMEHHGVVGPAQGSKPRELLRGYSA
jgi:S-DNA-T family DNA segregation ATPase FtsK/SpoIIIE